MALGHLRPIEKPQLLAVDPLAAQLCGVVTAGSGGSPRARQSPTQPIPTTSTPAQLSTQPLPSASPGNPQVSQPAATSSPQPNKMGKSRKGSCRDVVSYGQS